MNPDPNDFLLPDAAPCDDNWQPFNPLPFPELPAPSAPPPASSVAEAPVDHYLAWWRARGATITMQGGLPYISASADMTARAYKRAVGIPRELIDATFETFTRLTTQHQGIAEAVRRWTQATPDDRGAGVSLVLSGPCGTGKSHLAVSALKTMADRWHWWGDARWFDWRVLVELFRQYDRDTDPIGELTEHRLIVIDDIGCSEAPKGSADRIAAMLSLRMSDLKPTIVTTNLVYPDGIRKIFGGQLMSRMEWAYTRLAFDQATMDYRQRKARR